MAKVTSWKAGAGKSTGGADNDVVITPLSGGSGEYISFVLKQTSGKSESSTSTTTSVLMASQLAEKSSDNSLTAPTSLSVDESAQIQMNQEGSNIKSFLSEFYWKNMLFLEGNWQTPYKHII